MSKEADLLLSTQQPFGTEATELFGTKAVDVAVVGINVVGGVELP